MPAKSSPNGSRNPTADSTRRRCAVRGAVGRLGRAGSGGGACVSEIVMVSLRDGGSGCGPRGRRVASARGRVDRWCQWPATDRPWLFIAATVLDWTVDSPFGMVP